MSANPRGDHDWLNKIQRRERFADFAFTLARIDWHYFTTHTFKNPLPREYERKAMFWRWASEVSKVCKVPLKNLLIALRCEQGESGGRPHLHALIGGVPSCNMMALRSQMYRAWLMTSSGATGDFRLYNRSLRGADYICKCLSGGANAYEINKFSIAEETTLSQSVFTLIRTLDATNERRYAQIMRKDRRVVNTGGAVRLAAMPAASSTESSIRDITASATVPGLSHPAPSMRAILDV